MDSVRSCGQSVRAVAEQLSALSELVAGLSDEQFAGCGAAGAKGSIGAHVRHTLDHVSALVRVSEGLDYESRERGTDVERSVRMARGRIDELVAALLKLGDEDGSRPVRFAAAVDVDGPDVELESTLGRELVFVLGHTIHHNAFIASMARSMGVAVPERFGWAPSTIRAAERAACAR